MTEFRHHPTIETLARYAAGHMCEAQSVVIATHAVACPDCRNEIHDFEALGGAALETIEPVAMSAGAEDRFWATLEADDAQLKAPIERPKLADETPPRIEAAAPLQTYLQGGLDNVAWRPLAPGVSQAVLMANGYRRGALRLLRIQPGTSIPRHSHEDSELTLILRGAYDDELGRYAEGDVADLDGLAHHSPTAVSDEPCICLIATNAPLKFDGLVGKLMQPFVGL
ncbi:MAG: ChrR family anti-sigma-E factor [Pseudomonadota bacterium]